MKIIIYHNTCINMDKVIKIDYDENIGMMIKLVDGSIFSHKFTQEEYDNFIDQLTWGSDNDIIRIMNII